VDPFYLTVTPKEKVMLDSGSLKLIWLGYFEIPFCIFMVRLGFVTEEMHEILIERWNRINQKVLLNRRSK